MVRPSPEAPAIARGAVHELGLAKGDPCREAVLLVVSELVTNVVRHASMTSPASIVVELLAEARVVKGSVCSSAPAFQPLPVTTADELASTLPESGYGLFVVDSLVDRWGIASNGVTCVWFEISRAA